MPRAALVIANPSTDPSFPSLPGAAREGELVAAALSAQGFEVNTVIQGTAMNVVAALFERPWGVLHIAAHAFGGRSGAAEIVLDQGVFLGPDEFSRMRRVPDLVFLNADHVGAALPESNADDLTSVLLKRGARAVLVASSSINDEGGTEFAGAFYEALTRGDTFGQAVLHARRVEYHGAADRMTWAAYQAFGDSDFRLAATAAPMAATATASPRSVPTETTAARRSRPPRRRKRATKKVTRRASSRPVVSAPARAKKSARKASAKRRFSVTNSRPKKR